VVDLQEGFLTTLFSLKRLLYHVKGHFRDDAPLGWFFVICDVCG